MLGAIAGDIIGSPYEFNPIKTIEFPLFTGDSAFTDDTVLAVAVADCILNNGDYAVYVKEYGRRYADAGYGGMFRNWLASSNNEPYNSFGNGSAMRVSPVGFAFNTLEEVLIQARKSAIITHNHPEGVKGAQAVAVAIFLARTVHSKDYIREYIEKNTGYNLRQTLNEIRPDYTFNATCQGSVPQSIIAFLESDSYEDAIRKAISLGGDADTMACIAGGIAEAYYGDIPENILSEVRRILDPRLLDIANKFYEKYIFSARA